VVEMFKTFDAVLAVFDFSLLESTSIPEEITKLLSERDYAKATKDFARADAVRDEITAKGYRIVDTKDGAVAEKIA
jgi:cysteinyl-tRNA synthetase